MELVTYFYRSTIAPALVGEPFLRTMRETVLYLAGQMSHDEFEMYMTQAFSHSWESFYRENSAMLGQSVSNALSTLVPKENVKAWTFDLLLLSLIGGDYNIISGAKSLAKGTMWNAAASPLVNIAIREAALRDGYKIVYGSKADEIVNMVSNTIFSGSPFAWGQLYTKIVSLPPEYLNEVFEAAGDTYTEERKILETSRTAVGYKASAASYNNMYTAMIYAKTPEEYTEVVVDEIYKCGEILQKLAEATSLEEIEAIEKDMYVEIVPTEVKLTDKVNIAFERDIEGTDAEKNVKVYQNGEDCTERFEIVKNGCHSVTVTPKETVLAEESFDIVYARERTPVVQHITFKEETTQSDCTGLVSATVRVADGSEETVYFAKDTEEVISFEEIVSVQPEDANATYRIDYDMFGNAFICVTAENGGSTAVYSIKKGVEATSLYTANVVKDGEASVKITCNFVDESADENLYVGVYNKDGRLILLEAYDAEGNCARRVPCVEGGSIRLICMNVLNMVPLTDKYEIACAG